MWSPSVVIKQPLNHVSDAGHGPGTRTRAIAVGASSTLVPGQSAERRPGAHTARLARTAQRLAEGTPGSPSEVHMLWGTKGAVGRATSAHFVLEQ